MDSWTSGYVDGIEYPFNYFKELTPNWLAFAALIRGQRAPAMDGAFDYAELGCGQGVTANVIAACYPKARVWANDFNPAHVLTARRLAAEAGLDNVAFSEASFAEALADPALPQFDFVVLHGIWTWISTENRAIIVEFLARRLKPGALVYLSYNSMPGAAASVPLRRLMLDQAAAANGPLGPRIEQARAFAGRLMALNPAFGRANPAVNERLTRVVNPSSLSQLAHEYFNRDWTLFYHADVVAELAEAKLNYLGSAGLSDQIDAIQLTAEQQALLAEIADPGARENARDWFLNRHFRRDVFVKGAAPLHPANLRRNWDALRFALIYPRARISPKLQTPLGEVRLPTAVVEPMLDALAEAPRNFTELAGLPVLADVPRSSLMEAVAILVSIGTIEPCTPAPPDPARAGHFNRAVLARAGGSAELNVLVSPLLGGGMKLDQIDQLMLLGVLEQAPDLAAFAWSQLAAEGGRLASEGRRLITEAEHMPLLSTRAAQFQEGMLPLLRQLLLA